MITLLSGSPRYQSNTLRVAKAISHHIHNNTSEAVRIIDFNGFDIPSINQGGIKADALTTWQKELYEACANANLIILLTPEYNWFPSAEIIQMLHSMTGTPFRAMWDNKVFATVGTSNGRGGRMPAVQLSYTLNKILNVFNCESVVSPKIFESQFTDKVLDAEGHSLGNEEYMKGLSIFVDYNLKLLGRWGNG
jgi:chromate reductase, NAD(P)H dehydrogenase (quinone)